MLPHGFPRGARPFRDSASQSVASRSVPVTCACRDTIACAGAARQSPDRLPYLFSRVIASAAFPATTQLAEPATTASSSNQRNPKSSMHSGKSGLMMT